MTYDTDQQAEADAADALSEHWCEECQIDPTVDDHGPMCSLFDSAAYSQGDE